MFNSESILNGGYYMYERLRYHCVMFKEAFLTPIVTETPIKAGSLNAVFECLVNIISSKKTSSAAYY